MEIAKSDSTKDSNIDGSVVAMEIAPTLVVTGDSCSDYDTPPYGEDSDFVWHVAIQHPIWGTAEQQVSIHFTADYDPDSVYASNVEVFGHIFHIATGKRCDGGMVLITDEYETLAYLLHGSLQHGDTDDTTTGMHGMSYRDTLEFVIAQVLMNAIGEIAL